MVNPNRTRRPRRSRAGFSILEALIAAAVLGIGLIALVKLHQSAMRGMKSSRDVGIAMDIANQAAEQLAGLPVASLPACGVPTGCKLTNNALAADFAAPKGGGCTRWVSDGPIPDRLGNAATAAANEAAARTNALPYRIDEVVAAHPDATYHQNTSIVNVFVCWRDDLGYVRQVQTSRIVLTGI